MRISRRMFAFPIAAATLLVSAGGASAAPVQVIKEGTIGILTTECNGGDGIYLEGTFRTVLRTSADGTIKQEAMIHLVGTGISGTKYIVNQPLQATISDTEFSGHSTAVLVSLGPQPNEIAFFRWDFASNLDSVEIVCRG